MSPTFSILPNTQSLVRAILCGLIVLAVLGRIQRVHASSSSTSPASSVTSLTKTDSLSLLPSGNREAPPPSVKPNGNDDDDNSYATTGSSHDNEGGSAVDDNADEDEDSGADWNGNDNWQAQRPGLRRKHGGVPIRWALVNFAVWGLAMVSLFGMCVVLAQCSRRARKWFLGREQPVDLFLRPSDYAGVQIQQLPSDLNLVSVSDLVVWSPSTATSSPVMPAPRVPTFIGFGVARGPLLFSLLSPRSLQTAAANNQKSGDAADDEEAFELEVTPRAKEDEVENEDEDAEGPKAMEAEDEEAKSNRRQRTRSA